MTEDTVCNMASMTKAITGACAMQLVEQGKLDLDSPITKWIPQAAELKVLAGWEGDKPVLRAPASDITLRQLMTHTSGMATSTWNADIVALWRQNRRRAAAARLCQARDLGGAAARVRPRRALALRPSIDWVGRLIVETSGKPLGAYMQENIFEPLGMASTGYAVTPDMAARQATIHQRAEDGSIAVADLPPQEGPVREYGGGGLKGTTPDYLRFIRMILNGGSGNGNQLLKPETVADMAKNHMGDIRVQLLETTDPSRSLDAEFFPGVPKSWGLTFMINEEQAPTGRPAGGLAWAGLYNTFFWIDPTNQVGGVFMSQLLPFVDTKTIQAFYDFELAYYGAASA